MKCCCDNTSDGNTSFKVTTVGSGEGSFFFWRAGKTVQHPLKSALSSQGDAFVAENEIIGIADGVSSVEDQGFDPLKLPAELLSLCVKEYTSRRQNSLLFDAESEDLRVACQVERDTAEFPLFLFSRASAKCASYGSTTCVLAILEECRLWTVNLGDSQLLVCRRTDGPPKRYPEVSKFDYSSCYSSRRRVSDTDCFGGYQIVHRTVPQQLFFNCPYQFSRMPGTDCSHKGIFRMTAEAADVGCFDILSGDIVILGSDGFFDNMFDDDILDILNQKCWKCSSARSPPSVEPSEVVHTFVEMAIQNARPEASPTARLTPFAKAAFDETGRRLGGGKPDDITVVVAYVMTKSERTKLSSQTGSTCQASSVVQQQMSPLHYLTKDAVQLNVCKEVGFSSGGARNVSTAEPSYGSAKSPYLFRQRESFPPRAACLAAPAVRASVHSIPQNIRTHEITTFDRFRQNALGRMENLSKGLVIPQTNERENQSNQRSEEKSNFSKVLSRLFSSIL